jgi:hypothetical protein
MIAAALAGYFPHLPPTPKPVGGPVPDRTIEPRDCEPRHFHGVEARRERRSRPRAWKDWEWGQRVVGT